MFSIPVKEKKAQLKFNSFFKPKKMKINFIELKCKIKKAADTRRPDLLAYVSLTFVDDQERCFTVNGFTIRKSKYNGLPYLMAPSRSKVGGGFFQFTLIENSLLKMIKKEVLKQFEYETIPVVEEDKR